MGGIDLGAHRMHESVFFCSPRAGFNNKDENFVQVDGIDQRPDGYTKKNQTFYHLR
jgi:hypothetical protein